MCPTEGWCVLLGDGVSYLGMVCPTEGWWALLRDGASY